MLCSCRSSTAATGLDCQHLHHPAGPSTFSSRPFPALLSVLCALQIQACLVLCVGVVGWTLSGLRRRREFLRLQAAGHRAFLRQRAGMDFKASACADQQQPAGHAKPQPAQAKPRLHGGPAHSAVLQERCSHCDPDASLSSAAACGAEADAGVVTSPGRQHTQHPAAAAAACASTAQHGRPALFKSTCSSLACSSHSSCKSGSSSAWPPLAVVLPVKGCRPHSTENWASQLDALYGKQTGAALQHGRGDVGLNS